MSGRVLAAVESNRRGKWMALVADEYGSGEHIGTFTDRHQAQRAVDAYMQQHRLGIADNGKGRLWPATRYEQWYA